MNASRIVVLLHQLSLTGAPRLTLDTLETIRGEASLRVVSWEGGPLVERARRLGPTVVLRSDGPRARAAAGWRVKALKEAAVLRAWKPQLVYVSSVEALHMVRKLRLGNVPVALYVHELGSALASFERTNPGLIASVPDRYAAISDAVARDLVDVMGVPQGLVGIVRPYVLPPVPEPSPDLGGAGRTPLVVGGAGKPSWTKGNDLWLLAARDAVDRLGADQVRFVWVGYRDNEDGLQFRSMITRLGLEGVVEVIPETDRPFEHFARFDIFAMASWEESASLVVLEAMAMSIPVICFAPTGGPAEEVGDAGVVIPEISPGRMADAIVDLARSPQRRLAMGSAGAGRVRAEFRREASLAALTKVFDAAVTSRGRS